MRMLVQLSSRLLNGFCKRLITGKTDRLETLHSIRQLCTNADGMDHSYQFETLVVTKPREYVARVELNRPSKLNAMNQAFWREIATCFEKLGQDAECRAVVLSGAGRAFTAGIDLADMGDIAALQTSDLDIARKAALFKKLVHQYQMSFTSIEKCPKPVIAAIHNACIGGGVDMVTACDIRYATQDAYFQIKEVDIGLAADVGTLQRLPKIVGNDSLVRELSYTARRFYVDEAKEFGLVSRIFPHREQLLQGALDVASLIASKSPVAVQGTKHNLIYSRDHGVQEGLEYMTAWNMCMLQSEDLMKAAMSAMEKKTATFSKL